MTTKILFEICSDYFNNQTEIEERKIGNLKILPKKGDLSKPNNGRGINLLHVVSKVVSIVTTSGLQHALEKFGTPLQFGSCLLKDLFLYVLYYKCVKNMT